MCLGQAAGATLEGGDKPGLGVWLAGSVTGVQPRPVWPPQQYLAAGSPQQLWSPQHPCSAMLLPAFTLLMLGAPLGKGREPEVGPLKPWGCWQSAGSCRGTGGSLGPGKLALGSG